MTLGFILFKYFPHGGLQRDFMQIALACQARGHAIRAYVLEWRGDIPDGFEVVRIPVSALTNHGRYARFAEWVRADLQLRPVDRVIGFNKVPGLDVYFAADPCLAEKVQELRHPLVRWLPRYRHFAAFERSVFDPKAATQILVLTKQQIDAFTRYYGTPEARFHVLAPGISRDRCAPPDAASRRAAWRAEYGLTDADYLLLLVGSGFRTKGLDRALAALAALPDRLRQHTRLLAIGADNPQPFIRLARSLGIQDRVTILPGRDDIPRFLLGADLLIHPAYSENAGNILIEAVVAGLPVLTTDVCGYAHHVLDAGAGRVLASPFAQNALDTLLRDMLEDDAAHAQWHANALRYAASADLFSRPEQAADIILAEPA